MTTHRTSIYFGDLDLSTEAGAKALLKRIAKGATWACGGQRTFSTYTGALERSFDECRDAAVHNAVKQLDAPLVTRLHALVSPGRTHRGA